MQISVILPCYNVSGLIDRCLESIVNQTIGVENLEIICVDDCSTDNTWDKLTEWEKRFPEQVMLVRCEVNGRQGTARNIGLTYASSEWVAFIDSDDWLELDYFEQMYAFAKTGKYEIITCWYGRDYSKELTFFDDQATGKESCALLVDNDEKRKEFLLRQCVGYNAWGKLIRKDLLVDNELYFPENLTYEDGYWGSMLHFYVKSAYILEMKLYHYYVNEASTVLTSESMHHMDVLTVQHMLWHEWEKRGFLNRFREELEYEHIGSCYMVALKAIIIRYENPSYEHYLLLREMVEQRIPDYENNKYISLRKNDDYHMMLLKSLKYPLRKKEFMEFVKLVKKLGL